MNKVTMLQWSLVVLMCISASSAPACEPASIFGQDRRSGQVNFLGTRAALFDSVDENSRLCRETH